MPNHAVITNTPGNQGGVFDVMAVILRRATCPTQYPHQPMARTLAQPNRNFVAPNGSDVPSANTVDGLTR
jgi:hypothetical protein